MTSQTQGLSGRQQPTETSSLLPSHSAIPSPSTSSSSSSLSTLLPETKQCSRQQKHQGVGGTRTPWAYLVHFLRQLVGVDDSKRSNVGAHARMVSDAIIGLSDGLTVPFALTAGLSSVDGIAARTIVYGGLAELIAGAISMGLGGYLGAISELQSWKETRRSENIRIATEPDLVEDDVRDIFASYDISASTLEKLTAELSSSPKFVDFIMEFHHGTPEPSAARALQSALFIALGYVVGGIIPLLPYFFVVDSVAGAQGGLDIAGALWISVAVMAVALFVFGYVKTCVFTGWGGSRCVKQGIYGGAQMVAVGGAAAGSAVALVKLFQV